MQNLPPTQGGAGSELLSDEHFHFRFPPRGQRKGRRLRSIEVRLRVAAAFSRPPGRRFHLHPQQAFLPNRAGEPSGAQGTELEEGQTR